MSYQPITTTNLAGLQIEERKVFGSSIDTNTGNASAGTQRVVLASNQPNVPVNISAATTSVLAGLRIFNENFPATQNVNITTVTTSAFAGIKVFQENTPTGTQNVSITAATTSVLAGIRPLVTINQATPGVTNNVSVSASTGAGTSVLVKDDTAFGEGVTTGILATTSRLWNGTSYDRPKGDSTNGAFVNIKSATTSTLAGIQIQLENKSVPIVTTNVVGIAVSGANDTTIIPGQANKRIYVYAWNLSFSGTTNAKFADGTTSKNLSGLYYGVANAGGGNSVNPNFLLTTPQPVLFSCTTGANLKLNLSAGVATGGSVSYFIL